MSGYNVAVVGATGLVGETIISILEERNFPIETIIPLASSHSVGREVTFHQQQFPVKELQSFDFKGIDFCFFSAGADVSSAFVPIATEQGAIVVDNTSCFRYENDVPLVVPEVNPDTLAKYTNRNIIANPNCSTIQLVVALAPIHKIARIKRINVATYQSVSGAGRQLVELLNQQVEASLNGSDVSEEQIFAYNVIPQIDEFQENSFTKEEMKLVWETQKILDDKNLLVNATAVRVPVKIGHSEAVNIETEMDITPDQVKEILSQSQGIKVVDDVSENIYPTPRLHGNQTDDVFVGRIRKDHTLKNGINLWIVADNLRKGAALNSIQIAETLIQRYI
jgi:aspartate-semialdehyde dehydrogenase